MSKHLISKEVMEGHEDSIHNANVEVEEIAR